MFAYQKFWMNMFAYQKFLDEHVCSSDHLKKAVRAAEKKQKPVADEQRELLLQLAFWVSWR